MTGVEDLTKKPVLRNEPKSKRVEDAYLKRPIIGLALRQFYQNGVYSRLREFSL